MRRIGAALTHLVGDGGDGQTGLGETLQGLESAAGAVGRGTGASERSAHPRRQLCLVVQAGQPRMGLAVLEEDQRGDATHAEGGGQFGRVTNVELAHLDLALVPLSQLFEPVVIGFMAAYPLATVDRVMGDRQLDLVEQGADLSIRIANLDADSLLHARRPGDGPRLIVGAPVYLRCNGMPREPEELAAHLFAVYANFQDPETLRGVAKTGGAHTWRNIGTTPATGPGCPWF